MIATAAEFWTGYLIGVAGFLVFWMTIEIVTRK